MTLKIIAKSSEEGATFVSPFSCYETEKLLPNLPRRAPLTFITLQGKLKDRIEGAFLSKINQPLTLALFRDNWNHLKSQIYRFLISFIQFFTFALNLMRNSCEIQELLLIYTFMTCLQMQCMMADHFLISKLRFLSLGGADIETRVRNI